MDAAPIGDWTGSERLPGFALSRDIARDPGEKVEAEINSFISRRHDQRVKGESERRIEAKRAEEERAGRIGVFRHLQRVYAARSLECGHAADELEEMA